MGNENRFLKRCKHHLGIIAMTEQMRQVSKDPSKSVVRGFFNSMSGYHHFHIELWWRHDVETFSAVNFCTHDDVMETLSILLSLCEGNLPLNGRFLTQSVSDVDIYLLLFISYSCIFQVRNWKHNISCFPQVKYDLLVGEPVCNFILWLLYKLLPYTCLTLSSFTGHSCG